MTSFPVAEQTGLSLETPHLSHSLFSADIGRRLLSLDLWPVQLTDDSCIRLSGSWSLTFTPTAAPWCVYMYLILLWTVLISFCIDALRENIFSACKYTLKHHSWDKQCLGPQFSKWGDRIPPGVICTGVLQWFQDIEKNNFGSISNTTLVWKLYIFVNGHQITK